MGIYTIRYGDSVEEIVGRYRNHGIKDKDTLWNSDRNKIMRSYWPKGIETGEDEIPLGYSFFVPSRNAIRDTIPKEGGVRTYIAKAPLKHLRLKLRYYNSYDHYMWTSYDWKSKFLKENYKTSEEIDSLLLRKSGVHFRNLGWKESIIRGLSINHDSIENQYNDPVLLTNPNFSNEDVENGKPVYYYFDHRSNGYLPTTKPLEEFKPVTANTMNIPKDAKWGEIRGDKRDVRSIWKKPEYKIDDNDPIDEVLKSDCDTMLKMGETPIQNATQDNYVYLFKRPLNAKDTLCELISTYKAGQDSYQEVTFNGEQSTPVPGSEAKNYIEILDFFNPNDPTNIDLYHEYYIYVSKIPLTDDVIHNSEYGLVKKVPIVGTLLPQTAWLFQKEPFAIPAKQLHEEYQKSGARAFTRDVISYPYQLVEETVNDEKNKQCKRDFVLYLNVPDMEHEAIRLNDIFSHHFKEFMAWKDSEKRSQETFLYSTIEYLKKQKHLSGSELDLEGEYEPFRIMDNFNYRKMALRCELAAGDLVAFLREEKFIQLLRNYGSASKEWEPDGGSSYKYEYRLQKILTASHRDLRFTHAGTTHFRDIVNDSKSYFSALMKDVSKKIVLDKELDVVKNDTPDTNPHGLNALRKTTDLLLLWFNEITPTVCKQLLKNNQSWKQFLDAFSDFSKVPMAKFALTSGLYGKLEKAIRQGGKLRQKRALFLMDIYSRTGDHSIEDAYDTVKANYRSGNKNNTPKWQEKVLIEGTRIQDTKLGITAISTFMEGLNLVTTIAEAASDENITLDEGMQILIGVLDLSVSVIEDNKTMLSRIFAHSTVLKLGKAVPVLSLASCVLDTYMSLRNMVDALDNDEYVIAGAHGISAVGYTLLATGVLSEVSVSFAAALGGELVIGGIAFSIGSVLSIIGLILVVAASLVLFFWSTEIQDWVRNGRFGRNGKRANIPMDQQIREFLKWLTEIDLVWVKHFRGSSSNNSTFIDIQLTPKKLTRHSSIILRDFRVGGTQGADYRDYSTDSWSRGTF